MKSAAVSVITAGLLISGASLIQAQSPAPPRIMRIFHEDIKSGKGVAHEKVESAYVRAFSKSGYPSYIGLESMTGTSQAWFIERYDTYEAMEKAIKLTQAEPLKATIDALDAQDGELRTGERGIIATYQPDLSYLPGTPLEAKLRYFNINVVRVRPGHTADFTEVRKLINAAFAKTGSQQRRVVYSVNSGMPIGTYLILAPMDSLKALDPRPGAMSMVDAFGPENLARVDKLMTEIQISAESTLFSVNPKMSNAPKEYITADADFWAPKPKPTAGKPAIAAKTSSPQ